MTFFIFEKTFGRIRTCSAEHNGKFTLWVSSQYSLMRLKTSHCEFYVQSKSSIHTARRTYMKIGYWGIEPASKYVTSQLQAAEHQHHHWWLPSHHRAHSPPPSRTHTGHTVKTAVARCLHLNIKIIYERKTHKFDVTVHSNTLFVWKLY